MRKSTMIFGVSFSLPLLLAMCLSLVAADYQANVPGRYWLKPANVSSVAALEFLFKRINYDWPLTAVARVPRVIIKALPVDLDMELPVIRKKAIFFRILLPIVLAENLYIQQQREWLLLHVGDDLPAMGSLAWMRLQQLANAYRFKGDLRIRQQQDRLLTRVDQIPVSLVLAQAAIESGWGTSRFVQQANNLFGHWTFSEKQGLLPLHREDEKRHRVRIFPDLRSSVRAYLKNLNTHNSYKHLRQLRVNQRAYNQRLSGVQLATGLMNYSERRLDYVKEVRRMIHNNQLESLGEQRLRTGTWRVVRKK